MVPETKVGGEVFSRLFKIDERIAGAVMETPCVACGGPLHRGNYERKPRGGALAQAGEEWTLRFSLCCGRRGCRMRATPPSVRFLGRKVYLEAAILVACAIAVDRASAVAARRVVEISARTIRRWQTWWGTTFVASAMWMQARARAIGIAAERLPVSLMEMFGCSESSATLIATMKFLAPLTTSSIADGSRFVREQ